MAAQSETTVHESVSEQLAQPIAVEDDNETIADHDSALGDEIESTYSVSLVEDVYAHVYANGRRYNSYADGAYMNPNDEDEQDRLDIQHHLWRLIMGGELMTAPIRDALRILDVGTGTGIWAIEVADENPQASVIGTDIAPIQPQWVPPNCHFYMEDAEKPWMFDEPFDYIHARAMGGAIMNWKQFHAEMFKNLKPGGWCELHEFEALFKCDDDSTPANSWLTQWQEDMGRVSDITGRDLNAAPLQKQFMQEAGFINVQDKLVKVPIGIWPKEAKMKEVGKFMLANLIKAVSNFTVIPYTKILKYSMEETEYAMERIDAELKDRKIHRYVVYHIVTGQKPQ